MPRSPPFWPPMPLQLLPGKGMDFFSLTCMSSLVIKPFSSLSHSWKSSLAFLSISTSTSSNAVVRLEGEAAGVTSPSSAPSSSASQWTYLRHEPLCFSILSELSPPGQGQTGELWGRKQKAQSNVTLRFLPPHHLVACLVDG